MFQQKPYYLIFLFTVLFSCTTGTKNIGKITAKNIAVDSTLTASAKIEDMIAPYKKQLTGEMESVLTYAAINFTKEDHQMQSTLGNLLADLCFDRATTKYMENTPIDFAMFNSGGLRSSIAAGNVTKEEAFKLMPFDNELVVVQLSGAKITELVQYFINSKSAHPLSKNMELRIKENSFDLKIKGKPFDAQKTYTVVTSDYLQEGGDNMNFFKDPVKLTKLNYKVRDAIIDYFQKVDTLKATIDKRIIIE
ncbi:5'-nucleotidase [uncultured Polaribacter sp.]|uniref:5'-nucleotidase n=1 Tax=uncultured Polaribacter sp. TaxID=174711 RepID=UPI0030DDC805